MMTTILTASVAVWRRQLAAVLGLTGLAAPAAAQRDAGARDSITWTYSTTFEWSAAAVDTTNYRILETCLAAIERARRHTERHELVSTGLWRDTLAPMHPRYRGRDPNERYIRPGSMDLRDRGPALLEPLPDTVVATARRCTHLIPTATALRHLREDGLRGKTPWGVLLQAYLTANRDTDVTAMMEQRLKELPAGDTAQRRAVVDTVLGAYLAVQPVRRKAIEALFEQRLRAAANASERIQVLDQFRSLAEWVGDTAAARARAAQIVAEWAQVPAGERQKDSVRYKNAEYRVRDNRRVLHRAAIWDSLRRSTVAYLRAQRVLIYGESAPTITGDTAPVVTADFWFRRGDTPRPRPGQVEFIVLVASCGVNDANSTVEGSSSQNSECLRLFAMLRRLGKRFPELGITVVVPADGRVIQRAYPDPAAEAETLRRWLHDEERLPGALAVQVIKKSRRPAPDRRIVRGKQKDFHYGENLFVTVADLAYPNYAVGSVLVDRGGLIVRLWDQKNGGNILENEEEFAELIAAALQQPR